MTEQFPEAIVEDTDITMNVSTEQKPGAITDTSLAGTALTMTSSELSSKETKNERPLESVNKSGEVEASAPASSNINGNSQSSLSGDVANGTATATSTAQHSGEEDEEDVDDEEDEADGQISALFPSARSAVSPIKPHNHVQRNHAAVDDEDESETQTTASSTTAADSATSLHKKRPSQASDSLSTSIAATRKKRTNIGNSNTKLQNDGPMVKIPAAKRKLKLDPEAQRQHEESLSKRTAANSLVQKALLDESGKEREFPCENQPGRDGDMLILEFLPSSRLQNELLEDLLVLTRNNMKELYDGSGSASWAWNDSRKRGELRNERMRWILLRSRNEMEKNAGFETPESNEKGIIGFVAFRFTAELSIPHTYLHELQIWGPMQGKGYGRVLMQAVESISCSVSMQLIMLTVFSSNTSASRFYEKLGFEIDEASPGPCYNLLETESAKSPYEIMSKVLDPQVLEFGCEKCSYRCRFQDTLQQHAGFKHGEPWPHPCKFPNCNGGTVHYHQLQKHTEIKHAAALLAGGATASLERGQSEQSSVGASAADDDKGEQNYVNTRVTFKSDGRKGTVVKIGDKGFYTVRMDGPIMENVVCRAGSFVGHQSQPVKKKVVDADYELALKLQYEDGWARKSSRINKTS